MKPAPIMSERRVSLIGAMLATIGPFSISLYTPAMPEIVSAFGTTEAAVKMSLSLYFAGFAFAQLVCGPLSDGLGRRPVTIAFMGIYTAASVLALLSPDIDVLIVARFLQGVGAAAGIAISRAIVRDLFTHEQSARIMNLIGIILGIGPAAAPTIGGIIMELFGWHAVFMVMVVGGLAVAVAVMLVMKETVARDLSRIRPRALAGSYVRLLATPAFMSASLVNAGAAGAIYAQATVLPFILMERVGLTASQFGLAMVVQSFSYLGGSLALRMLLPRFGAFRLAPAGLAFVAVGSIATFTLLRLYEPTFLIVMGPVGVYAFGIAFLTPSMSTSALAPFPHNAGAAAAMLGFMQMAVGLAGGTLMALIGDPVAGMATVIPCIGLMVLLSFAWWRRLPPLQASMVVRSEE